MYPMLVKADMSQVPIGWSKAVVSQDMDPTQVTACVTHLPIVRPKAMLWRLGSHAGHGRVPQWLPGWLKALASRNMEPISVTVEVSQWPLSR